MQDSLTDLRLMLLPRRIQDQIAMNLFTGCWEWQGSTVQDGYGLIRWNGKRLGIHRLVYELLVGPIPKGLVLDHVRANGCMSRACCWPGHLEPVTNRVNILRGLSVVAINAAKTHCPKGHKYDVIDARGDRQCSVCANERQASRRRAVAALDGFAVIPARERTDCPQGHPYDEENTVYEASGARACKICRREKWNRYDARRRGGKDVPLRPTGPPRRPLVSGQDG